MFPISPVKDEIYIVANKEWLFNGYGFILVPDSSLTEELDPIWDSEKHEYVKRGELQDYVPMDILDSTLADYVPIDILDSTLVDYVKQEEISDIIPQFQKIITQDQFVWYNDYLVIDIGEISHSKKVTVLSLYIYTSKGIIKGTPIVSYPTAKVNNDYFNFTYFYLKDTLGIISRSNDIEKISISFNTSFQNKEIDIQGTLGRNILFEETSGNRVHGQFTMDSFHGVYPENTHQKILSIDLPEVTGNVVQSFQPYLCSKYECNLVTKPYINAAVNENYLSNPEILTIGSHYSSTQARQDITSAPDKFLSNTIAVSAGTSKDDTNSLWTSYGYGVEFFESWKKEEIDQRYPNKDIYDVIARVLTTSDNQGLIYRHGDYGWISEVEVGQKIWIRYSTSNEVEVTVTEIISDSEIRIDQTIPPILEIDSHKYVYAYVTVGRRGFYRPQQSPVCGIVAAKFRKIQDKTNANWQVCREAARATASNSTFTLDGTDKIWTTNWDMYRGFGIIDVDLAVEYIHQHYIDNKEYKKSAAYTLPKSNPFLGVDDIERDTFVSKANLEEYVNGYTPTIDWDNLTNKPSAFTPTTHTHQISQITNLQDELNSKKPNFSENSAFNKNFGTTTGTVAQGNDIRILNGQTAYGWGNHALAGYIKTYTDTIYSAGAGLTLTGTVFSLPITTLGSGSFIKSLTQTANGITVNLDTPPNTIYTHPTTSGYKHIPAGGSTGQILRWFADGTAAWETSNTAFNKNFGTAEGTVSEGNHVHGNITNVGAIGTTANLPIITTTSGVLNTTTVANFKTLLALNNVNNTSDLNKPISNSAQTALNAKENTISAGTTTQYWRGDKSWQILNTTVVPEGTNLYHTNARVKAYADTLYSPLAHTHSPSQVGLGNVGNYPDYARKTQNETISDNWTFLRGDNTELAIKHSISSYATDRSASLILGRSSTFYIWKMSSQSTETWGNNPNLHFENKTTEFGAWSKRVTVLFNGNVGINNTAPTEKLHVVGNGLFSDNDNVEVKIGVNNASSVTSRTSSILLGRSLATTEGHFWRLQSRSTSAWANHPTFTIGNNPSGGDFTNALTILNNRNVGLSIDNPTERLHVVGNGLFQGNISASGTITPGSDRRLKEDIKPLTDSTLPKVLKLKPVTFKKKENDDSRDRIGFIAQDVIEIYPEFVNEIGGEENYLGVDYGGMTSILVKAIQEMKTYYDQKIIELEERISELEK